MLFSSVIRLGTPGRFNVHAFTRMMGHSVSRRPVKILNLENIEANDAKSKHKTNTSQVARSGLETGESQIQKLGIDEHTVDTTDPEPWKPRCIALEDDLKLSKYMVVVKSRPSRRKAGLMLVEGTKLINDALASNVKLEALFVSRRTDIANIALPDNRYGLYFIPYRFLKKWTDVVTTNGILGIFHIPSLVKRSPDPESIPLKVICDNIRDPGNMGAILRVLAGVGCQKIMITKGCVDIWSPKVLRSACGAHFRVPIEYDKNWTDITAGMDEDASVFLADCVRSNRANTLSSPEADGSDEFDTHTNSETGGNDSIDTDSSSKADGKSVPDLDDSRLLVSDSPSNSSSDDESLAHPVTSHGDIQSLPYYDLKFKANGSNILVVSNESSGLSQEALAFTARRQGVKVHIPLCGKVESLNVVSALSIIAFEMKRQAILFNVTA